jgi:hypothetical protein
MGAQAQLSRRLGQEIRAGNAPRGDTRRRFSLFSISLESDADAFLRELVIEQSDPDPSGLP